MKTEAEGGERLGDAVASPIYTRPRTLGPLPIHLFLPLSQTFPIWPGVETRTVWTRRILERGSKMSKDKEHSNSRLLPDPKTYHIPESYTSV